MELLLVEDDAGVLRFLQQALEKEGHEISTCRDCEELEDLLQAGTVSPEVIVLDRMLRGRDGLKLVPSIRRRLSSARILILSAINTPDEKAAALDLGADDYLPKPFSSVELSARIRALGRRGASGSPMSALRLGDVTVDLMNRTVFAHDCKVDLSNKEFQVLLALIRTPGRVFNKYQFLNKVWDVQASPDVLYLLPSTTLEEVKRSFQSDSFVATEASIGSQLRERGYTVKNSDGRNQYQKNIDGTNTWTWAVSLGKTGLGTRLSKPQLWDVNGDQPLPDESGIL